MTRCDGSTQPFIAAGNHHVLLQRHTLSLQKSSLQHAKCSSAKFSTGVVHWSCKDLLRYLNIYPAFKYLPNIKSISQRSMPSPLGMHSHVGGRALGSCAEGQDCQGLQSAATLLPPQPSQGGMGHGVGWKALKHPFFFPIPFSPSISLSPSATPVSPRPACSSAPGQGFLRFPPKPKTEDLCSHTTLLEHP